MSAKHGAIGLLLALAAGCAVTNEALLENAVSAAGLPSDVEGFHVLAGRLKGPLAMFHYARKAPPTDLWVLRFTRSPAEQKPETFTDLDSLLRTVAKDKQDFTVTEKTRFLAEGARPVKAAYYSYREDGQLREGCFCVWEEPDGEYVFALNCFGSERPPVGLIESLLVACGAQ